MPDPTLPRDGAPDGFAEAAAPIGMPPRPRIEARHLRRAIGQAGAILPGRRFRGRCVFMHLPKCGGTSLIEGLRGALAPWQRAAVIDALATRRAASVAAYGRDSLTLTHEDFDEGGQTFALREQMLLSQMALDVPLIAGHVLYSSRAEAAFGDRYDWVTVMRDPVARTWSNYRMAVRAGILPDDPDRWLDGPVGRRMAQAALRYLAGRNTIPEAQVPLALTRARARLDRFRLIGFLDDLPGFRAGFRSAFGAAPALGRLNAAPMGEAGPDPAVRARLEALCAPDLDLWELARARFVTPARGAPARTGPARSGAGSAVPARP